jgi:DNA-binding CsgD family transcriptional regulator
MTRKESDLEIAFDTQYRRLAFDLPELWKWWRFHPDRKWEFDRAIPHLKIGIELEGIYRGGRSITCHNCGQVVRARKADGSLGAPLPHHGYHMRYERFLSDKEKYNAAQTTGWFVLRFVYDDVHGDPHAMIETIRQTVSQRSDWIPEFDPRLSEREMEVLYFLAAGYTSSEIATRLKMAENTVRSHAATILQKLNASNRCVAVARALAWNIIKPVQIPWKSDLVSVMGKLDKTAQNVPYDD